MGDRNSTSRQQSCPVSVDDDVDTARGAVDRVPGCDSGPVGRLGFVVRELQGAVRRWREARRPRETGEQG